MAAARMAMDSIFPEVGSCILIVLVAARRTRTNIMGTLSSTSGVLVVHGCAARWASPSPAAAAEAWRGGFKPVEAILKWAASCATLVLNKIWR